MPRALHAVPSLPSLHTALERFLARSRFAARTRESYAQDLAPLVAQHGDAPVTGLTHQTTVAFLAAQEHLAASARAANGYSEVELKRFSGHLSLRSLEIYIAHNREAAKRKARSWEHRDAAGT